MRNVIKATYNHWFVETKISCVLSIIDSAVAKGTHNANKQTQLGYFRSEENADNPSPWKLNYLRYFYGKQFAPERQIPMYFKIVPFLYLSGINEKVVRSKAHIKMYRVHLTNAQRHFLFL